MLRSVEGDTLLRSIFPFFVFFWGEGGGFLIDTDRACTLKSVIGYFAIRNTIFKKKE